MLPRHLAGAIDFKTALKPAPRRVWTEDQIKDLRKTARVVGAEPWRLVEAQAYLEDLCKGNEEQVVKSPPPLIMVLERDEAHEIVQLPDFSDLLLPDDPAPRNVAVAHQRLKRPAAAAVPPAAAVVARKRPATAMRRPAAAAADDIQEPEGPAELPAPVAPGPVPWTAINHYSYQFLWLTICVLPT